MLLIGERFVWGQSAGGDGSAGLGWVWGAALGAAFGAGSGFPALSLLGTRCPVGIFPNCSLSLGQRGSDAHQITWTFISTDCPVLPQISNF